MVICCDTSFLFSLYGSDVHSQRAVAWTAQCTAPIRLSALAHYELGNALRFAEFRRVLRRGEAAQYWALFELAVTQGRLMVESCNLADVIDEAKRISATHTLNGGHRAFDILHVASALHLRAAEFLTFDTNQKKLAKAEGLNVPL